METAEVLNVEGLYTVFQVGAPDPFNLWTIKHF